jgi:hypothetical protein
LRNAHAQVAALGHQLDREMAGYVLEDTRLSTLQRKLAKETEPTVALALALFINDCILKVQCRYSRLWESILTDGR